MEWHTQQTLIRSSLIWVYTVCFSRSSLIWVYTVCPGPTVRKYRINTVWLTTSLLSVLYIFRCLVVRRHKCYIYTSLRPRDCNTNNPSLRKIQSTVNHFIFACSLFREFVIEKLLRGNLNSWCMMLSYVNYMLIFRENFEIARDRIREY